MRTEKKCVAKNKRCVWKNIDIFDAETLNGQQKHSCYFLKH
jgi:hypothetical protein